MELRHLRYFVAVAEELNFRRAAERLHLSTPTLSQQIKDLEDFLAVRLFDRDTTRVSLTGPGDVFLAEARLVLAQVEQATTAAKEAAKGKRGALHIGNAGPLSHGFMPSCVQAFGENYPDVDVSFMEVDLGAQAMAVKDGTIQIGFTLRKDGIGLEGLGQHLVVNAPLRVVLGATHPLAKKKQLSLADFTGQRLFAIGGTKVSTHSELLMRIFSARGIKISPPKAVSGYEAFMAMVASGQGISLLQKTPSFGSLEGLTTRPLKESGPDLMLEARVIWRKEPLSLIVENFVKVLRTIRP